jgi:hypothetical protein
MCGSPPRVRGILQEERRVGLDFEVHPRVCGEYVEDLGPAASNTRFTPACAGNTHKNVYLFVPPITAALTSENDGNNFTSNYSSFFGMHTRRNPSQ